MAIITMETPTIKLSGIGEQRAKTLSKIGINTVGDLIYFFPRSYENRGNIIPLSKCTPDVPSSFILTVATKVSQVTIKRGMTISKFRAYDESGSIEIIFFNTPYVKDVFQVGSEFRFYGKPGFNKNKLQLTNPKYEPYIEGVSLPDFVPIYSSGAGLSSKQLDKLISSVINDVLPEIIDPIPDYIRIKNELPTLTYAIKNAHFPESEEALTKSLTRLSYEEMLHFGIGISLSTASKKIHTGIKFSPCSLTPFTKALPYELTNSQKQAINDIYRDTVIEKNGAISPMARIIVGDVGCGKTVCAFASIYLAAKSGYQSALMVPTEILARQHYDDAIELLSRLGLKVELLLGSTTAKEKRRIKSAISKGMVDLVIGTHALLTDDFDFNSLGLIITDEQHRFGVAQRGKLKERAVHAHLLVMSATPIPRTLALAMYGDLDISRITEMPKGRQRVNTFVVNESYRMRLNDFILKQTRLGGQVYIVCPSIEKSEDDVEEVTRDYIGSATYSQKSLNLKNAVDYAEELKIALPSARIEVLHGRMKPDEKDEIMSRFSKKETEILVSTTVIEVGVNVPNASLMIVENAERFGLSQLHQLRGRVGRGTRKSYCVLVSDVNSEKSNARLDVMKSTYDGYEIAEKDLLLRGPGDFFYSFSGDTLRQSGGFSFKFASMCDDYDLFAKAFADAKMIIDRDPELKLEEHSALKNDLSRRLSIDISVIS